jgi:AcrR family transcriptional regulator
LAQPSKREQLLQAAVELFARKGFHGVGIDAISEKACVTKKTLYYHFKSKEELILATLRYYDERFRNDFMKAVESRTTNPVGRLLVVFDVVEEWFRRDDFYGCMFVGAMGEYPDEGTPIRCFCQEAKGLMLGYIKNLVEKSPLHRADQLSEQIILLLEGAITMAQVNNSPFSAVHAKKAVEILIRDLQGPADKIPKTI